MSQYARIVLESKGYDIFVYKSLAEALPQLRKHQFDLIIVEPLTAMIDEKTRKVYKELWRKYTGLPPLKDEVTRPGIEIIFALRALAPSVPIIIYTNILKDGPYDQYHLQRIRYCFPDIMIFFKIRVEDELISAAEALIRAKATPAAH